MILRRFTDAIRRQDWFTVALEILIVMIGIFLGLQVTEWNQSRVDRADEVVFLQALHQDIVEMERISKRSQNLRLNYFTDLELAANVLFGVVPPRPLTDTECAALGSSHVVDVIPTSLPSLTALRDAGRTGIIQNANLLSQLAKLQQRQEALIHIADSVSDETINITTLTPDAVKLKPLQMPLEGGPESIEYDMEYFCDTDALRSNQLALNAITSNLEGYDAVLNHVGIKPWVEQTKNVHAQLDAILNIQHGVGAQ